MWLIVPSISSPSAWADADSTGASSSLFQALAQSAALSGTPSPAQSWRRKWKWQEGKPAPWLRSLCGRVCEPSTAARGVESWIASLRASRARATASPAGGCSTPTRATCGRTPGASFAKWSAGGSCWRTCTDSLFPAMDDAPQRLGYSESWPRTGGMRNGSCFLRPPLALRTGGSGSSCSPGTTTWPTARAEESESAGNHPWAMDSLTGATAQWTTPQAHDVGERGAGQTYENNGAGNACLARDARQWLTPHGMTGVDATGKMGAGGEFAQQAAEWCTPTDRTKGGASDSTGSWKPGQRKNQLAEQVESKLAPCGHPDLPSENAGLPSRPRLNPLFVAWLMGWPLPDANGCGFSATELSRFKRRWRSTFCDLVSRIEP